MSGLTSYDKVELVVLMRVAQRIKESDPSIMELPDEERKRAVAPIVQEELFLVWAAQHGVDLALQRSG